MKKIKGLILKYKEILLYLIFGVLTTIVSIVSFGIFGLFIPSSLYLITNIISWIISVAFAFVTNKLFVFESKNWGKKELIDEVPKFLGARVFSFVVEEKGCSAVIGHNYSIIFSNLVYECMFVSNYGKGYFACGLFGSVWLSFCRNRYKPVRIFSP
jgi:putative flippase GtrA